MTKDAARERIIDELRTNYWSPEKVLLIITQINSTTDCIPLPRLVYCASQVTGAKPTDVLSPSRLRNAAHARRLIYKYYASEGFSVTWIGNKFKRDHSTVSVSLKTMNEELEIKWRETVENYENFNKLLHEYSGQNISTQPEDRGHQEQKERA